MASPKKRRLKKLQVLNLRKKEREVADGTKVPAESEVEKKADAPVVEKKPPIGLKELAKKNVEKKK